MYAPIVKEATSLRQHEIDANHTAVLMTDIEAEGDIEYAFLLVVFRNGEKDPVLFISSEPKPTGDKMAALLEELGLDPSDTPEPEEGSHFLCAFVSGNHYNHGASDDWGDEAKFEPRALALAKELLAD